MKFAPLTLAAYYLYNVYFNWVDILWRNAALALVCLMLWATHTVYLLYKDSIDYGNLKEASRQTRN